MRLGRITESKPAADEALIVEALEGSEKAFNALVDRYGALVYRVALGITAAPQEAEEIVQETFLRVFRNMDKFSSEKASFKTWVLTIARNQSINTFKSLRRKAAVLINDAWGAESESEFPLGRFQASAPDPEAALRTKQELAALHRALKKLPERQRTALLLKAQEDLSYAEIAQIMDTSASSVESLIFRARRRLLEITRTR
jgi:RNA polymerase sigma-70 factor (ECF subfamily)